MIEYPKELLEWCEALESGKFPQGLGYLREEIAGVLQGYCCLGVFVQLHGGFDEDGYPIDGDLWPVLSNRRAYRCTHRIGADSVKAVFPHHTETQREYILRELAAMNDTTGMTFGEISEWIKMQYRQSLR